MMPLRRGRGVGGVGILADRDAIARLRLNQPDPMSDIHLSWPAAMRRRVFSSVEETST
jgi:hypothetical protein